MLYFSFLVNSFLALGVACAFLIGTFGAFVFAFFKLPSFRIKPPPVDTILIFKWGQWVCGLFPSSKSRTRGSPYSSTHLSGILCSVSVLNFICLYEVGFFLFVWKNGVLVQRPLKLLGLMPSMRVLVLSGCLRGFALVG